MNQKDIIDKLTEALRDLLDEAPPGTIAEDALWTELPGMFNHLPAARAALAEYDAQRQTLAPSQAGAVAWQVRFLDRANWWTGWAQVESEEAAKHMVGRYAALGQKAEYRALYLSPPAAVPVEALEGLVAKIVMRLHCTRDADLIHELTQLIKERSNG